LFKSIKTLINWISFACILFLSTGLSYAQIDMTGLNEAEYIYKAAEDSLSHYFYNETYLRLNYNNIEVGLSFIAELPKYDQFEAIEDLHPNNIDYRWDDRYIQLSLTNLRIRAGSFTEFYGAGIVLRSYRDKTYDHDTRLIGLNAQYSTEEWEFKGLYAGVPNENSPNHNDLIGGLDLTRDLLNFGHIGLSLTSQQIRRFDNRYSTRIVAGSRVEFFTDYFDFYSEYAESKSYRKISGETRGQAIYGLANAYVNKFTITGGYKKFTRFDDRLNDLPTLNSSEEPLSERLNPGEDEEGLLGQVRFNPDFTTELGATYSEAWNSDFSIRQSDFFVEGRKYYDSFTLGLEYAQLEMTDKVRQHWQKEITPAVLLDFNLLSLPTHIRTELGYHEKVEGESSRDYFNPLLQFDLFFNRFSLSLISEFEIEDLNELDELESWIGIELTTDILPNTDLKIFIGEERGGKVCRSGVCYYTTPFKGLRVNLTTRF